jgi:hypothetical protein
MSKVKEHTLILREIDRRLAILADNKLVVDELNDLKSFINTVFNVSENRIDLLNSEGAILICRKAREDFLISDEYKVIIARLNSEDMFKFTRGELDVTNSRGKVMNYMNYPGSMKPDLRRLDIFIGVDTTKYSY